MIDKLTTVESYIKLVRAMYVLDFTIWEQIRLINQIKEFKIRDKQHGLSLSEERALEVALMLRVRNL
jgi:hypothetical protein